MTQFRASFDAEVGVANGGGLSAQGFRVDIPALETSDAEIAALFVASLGLLMTSSVRLSRIERFAEAHKGTRRGPSDTVASTTPTAGAKVIELSHVISEGMITYPGLPAPEFTPHLTREASREVYAPGTEFAIDSIRMVGNTGTYLDSPYHRFADGADLSGMPLENLVDLPAVVVDVSGSDRRGIDVGQLAAFDVTGCAVLLQTGADARWGTPAYAEDSPFLTEHGARWLAEHGAALVGIDAVNIDELVAGGARPAHSILLEAGIPIVEHLTGLADVPRHGASFTAAPPRVEGFGTFPVRAYA